MDITASSEGGAKTPLTERRIQVDLSEKSWLEIDFDSHRGEPIVVSIGARARNMRTDPLASLLIQPHAGGVASVLVGEGPEPDAPGIDWRTRVFQVSKSGHKSPLSADEFVAAASDSERVQVNLEPWSEAGPRIRVATLHSALPAPGVRFPSLHMMVLIHASNLVSFRFRVQKGFILTPEVFSRLMHRAEARRKWLKRLSFGLLGRRPLPLPPDMKKPKASDGEADEGGT